MRSGKRPACAARSARSSPPVFYDDRKGRSKAVRYWLMERRGRRLRPQRGSRRAALDAAGQRRAAADLRARRRTGRKDRRLMNRDRFSGLKDGWARLDGAAGSQVLDSVIEAMADFMRSGAMANHGGAFKAAHETDELVAAPVPPAPRCSAATPRASSSARSFTATTMRFAATVVRELGPGDEIVCTRLDHDSNVRPWVIAAERAGATVNSPSRPRARWSCRRRAVEAVLSERTKWVAVTAASNAVGTVPDLDGIVAAAHARRRARVHRRRPRHPAPPLRPRHARRRRARLLAPTSGSARTSRSCAPARSC